MPDTATIEPHDDTDSHVRTAEIIEDLRRLATDLVKRGHLPADIALTTAGWAIGQAARMGEPHELAHHLRATADMCEAMGTPCRGTC